VTLIVVGDLLMLATFVLIFFVFRQNRFASAAVELQTDQHVVTTGVYGVVRHPMYAGAVLLFVATPLALASFWALIVSFLLIVIIVLRLIDEERYLRSDLAGYDDYCRQVRYGLVPLVW
jgi:protein-S-isoprenylcysteine O-methyltransferase Ste14